MVPTNAQAATLNLGALIPDVATVEQLVRDRMRFLKSSQILLFAEFCAAVANQDQLARDARQRALDARLAASSDWEDATQAKAADRARNRLYVDGEANPALADLLAMRGRGQLTPDFAGWLRYLGELTSPAAVARALQLPQYRDRAGFTAAGIEDGVLIVAQRGWGKSELLKALIRHDVEAPNDTNPQGTLIVLDPGGDLARQVARWPELSGPGRLTDRLVFIEPNLKRGLTVGINPLDGRGLDHEGRNAVATMLAEALDANTAPLSMNMDTLVIHCATVLLARPGSTLRDLRAMLRDPADDPDAAALLQLARAYPDPDTRDFFERDFPSPAYTGSRDWLQTRLLNMFANHGLASMFGGAATVDLRTAIEARKVILVNLEPLKAVPSIGRAGRLLVAAIGAVIRARADLPAGATHAPVNLVVDEVSLLAGRALVDLLAQLRKRGLNLFMAQQVMGSRFSPEDKAVLLGNTGSRFIGGTDRQLVGDMLGLGSRETAALPPIAQRQFWSTWRGFDGPRRLDVREDLAGLRLSVSDAEWAGYAAEITRPIEAGGIYREAKPSLTDADTSQVPHVTTSKGPHVTTSQASDTPISQDYEVPPSTGLPISPVEPVKLQVARPARRPRAKPADVVVKEVKPRTRKATKPIVKKAKAPDVKEPEREL